MRIGVFFYFVVRFSLRERELCDDDDDDEKEDENVSTNVDVDVE